MVCSQTGGMTVGAGGVTSVGIVSGGLAGNVEVSEPSGGPSGVPGDTRPLGAVDMVGGVS